jgi:hypothetical protein
VGQCDNLIPTRFLDCLKIPALGINVNQFKEVTASVVDFSCKLATGANNVMVHMPPMSLPFSLTPVVHHELQISWQNFEKSLNGALGIIRGEDKSKTEFTISYQVPLSIFFVILFLDFSIIQ